MGIRRQIALARASLHFAACYHRPSGVRTLIARVLGLVLCLICRAIVPVKSGMIPKDHLCFHHIALSRNAGGTTAKEMSVSGVKKWHRSWHLLSDAKHLHLLDVSKLQRHFACS